QPDRTQGGWAVGVRCRGDRSAGLHRPVAGAQCRPASHARVRGPAPRHVGPRVDGRHRRFHRHAHARQRDLLRPRRGPRLLPGPGRHDRCCPDPSRRTGSGHPRHGRPRGRYHPCHRPTRTADHWRYGMNTTNIPITPVRRQKPGAFSIEVDPAITDPASVRTSFLILLDGDLVMSPEHLGVAFMASVLREAGFTCEIREVRHGLDEERTIAELVEYDPALICFTLMSLNVVSAASLSERLAQALPDAVVACGGPAGTSAGTEVLRKIPHADVVAIGEGEPTILDLVQRIALGGELSDCPGICYRDAQGRPRQNPPRPLVHDLDALPHPARDQLISHGNELEYVRVSTSRGCVARCTFCAAPHTNNRVQQGKAWRGRSPERVVDEIVQLVRNHRFRTFDFIDSTFE